MKLNEILNEHAQIEAWLTKHKIENYTIAANGLVNVDGDVNLYKEGLTEIPIQFDSVTGGFFVGQNKLISLKGSPRIVEGEFDCIGNKLTSLEYGPQTVGKMFFCSNNQLTSLNGAPSSVGSAFYCNDNQLTSLNGAPSSVGGDFSCIKNQLVSLEGISDFIKKISGGFYANSNPLKKGGIGLILVEELYMLSLGRDFEEAFGIIEKYLQQPEKIFECQSELIEAGYEEFAKL